MIMKKLLFFLLATTGLASVANAQSLPSVQGEAEQAKSCFSDFWTYMN